MDRGVKGFSGYHLGFRVKGLGVSRFRVSVLGLGPSFLNGFRGFGVWGFWVHSIGSKTLVSAHEARRLAFFSLFWGSEQLEAINITPPPLKKKDRALPIGSIVVPFCGFVFRIL